MGRLGTVGIRLYPKQLVLKGPTLCTAENQRVGKFGILTLLAPGFPGGFFMDLYTEAFANWTVTVVRV